MKNSICLCISRRENTSKMLWLKGMIGIFVTLIFFYAVIITIFVAMAKHLNTKIVNHLNYAIVKQKLLTQFTYPMEGNITGYAADLERGVAPSVTPYDQHDYEFKILNKNKCDVSTNFSLAVNSSMPISVTCLVKSAVDHFENRKVIRNTWGSEKQFDNVQIRSVFLLGYPAANDSLQLIVEEENGLFKDIVQGDFIDTYYNNTIKTLMALQWATKFCANSKFYLFVDDDYLVSMENLLMFLLNPSAYPANYTYNKLNSIPTRENTTVIHRNTTGTPSISVI